MSKKPEKPSPLPPAPAPGGSGEHPAVRFLHKQLEQYERGTDALEHISKRLDRVVSEHPAPIPREDPLEGDWTITIRGRGPHHNADPGDANRIAARLVRELRGAGHVIVKGTFNNGAEEDIVAAIEGEPR